MHQISTTWYHIDAVKDGGMQRQILTLINNAIRFSGVYIQKYFYIFLILKWMLFNEESQNSKSGIFRKYCFLQVLNE